MILRIFGIDPFSLISDHVIELWQRLGILIKNHVGILSHHVISPSHLIENV